MYPERVPRPSYRAENENNNREWSTLLHVRVCVCVCVCVYKVLRNISSETDSQFHSYERTFPCSCETRRVLCLVSRIVRLGTIRVCHLDSHSGQKPKLAADTRRKNLQVLRITD